jgi:anti-sigma B factor antagonist
MSMDQTSHVLTFEGELDLATVEPFRTQLDAAAKAAAGCLVVDLSAVTFLDSVALAVLVRARRELADRGRLVLVITPGSFPALVLAAAGLTQHFAIVETAAQALAAA